MSSPSAFGEADRAACAVPAEALRADLSSRCFHCGLPNPAGERWRCEIDGALRSFCCAGCLGIARTIQAAGLDAFYANRTAAADKPDTPREADDEWSRWDSAPAQAGYVRDAGDGEREASLILEGIHCGACIWLIESWLGRQPGVIAASVNFATRRASVRWRADAARLSGILRAVAAIGYRAFPYDPSRREALARGESRALLLRVAVALLAMMQVMMLAVPTYVTIDGVEPAHRRLLEWASLTLTLPALLYSAAPFFRGAWRDLRLRHPGMDVPVALGLGAAFAASAWSTLGGGSGDVYYDSITMFIALLLVARYVELVARRRAGDAIESCARARPAVAERFAAWPDRADVSTVGAADLAEGDAVLVRPGATAPADGVVVDGRASVEEAILTGESRPRGVEPGERVLAGSVVRDGALVVRVTGAGEATRLAAIERLAERAAAARPRAARLADRVAGGFVAALLVVAALTAVVWSQLDPSRALAVTFAVLVVSCPCALSLATPAALAAATAALARRQIVIARADALETLARTTHVVFDKTGTLTRGRVALLEVALPGGLTREQALALAASLEARSEHPIAQAFRGAGVDAARLPVAREVTVIPGSGVEGVIDGRRLRIGRPDFAAALAPRGADGGSPAPARGDVVLADATGVLARFRLGDALRPNAAALVAALRGAGIVPVLLSGDSAANVAEVARAIGIDDAQGDLQPEDKRDRLLELQRAGAVVAMVGDGVNDAPSLAQAQVSISLGSATPLAQWTADVVVLSDELERIGEAIEHARRAFRVVRQNLGWAFVYNLVAIPAAAAGLVTPLVAALGMSASSLLVVSNALTVARVRSRTRPAAASTVASPTGS